MQLAKIIVCCNPPPKQWIIEKHRAAENEIERANTDDTHLQVAEYPCPGLGGISSPFGSEQR